MNKAIFRLIIAAAMTGAIAPAAAKSPKRGVSESNFSLKVELDVVEPGVSWYYNWGNTPSTGINGEVAAYNDMEFVPMCWNANYNADNIRNYVASHPGCKYLLGFNEPNFTAQSNMTPAEAAEKWAAVRALAKELGLKLVAPALNYSPNPPYNDPLKWMDEFVAIVGKDAFDYTAIHCYGGFGVLQDLATKFYEKYGKEVWVTEFCYWPDMGANASVTPATQIASMMESVKWLEQTPWIYRYAWFKAKGACDSKKGPNYGLIVPQTGYDPRTLSAQGYVYTYMSEFDKEKWNAVGEAVAAADYVDASQVSLYPGEDATCSKPIEISAFCYGASADWQFDILREGTYEFVMTVAGKGEPERFDPTLQLQLVKEDGTVEDLTDPVQLQLPNSDTDYETRTFRITLPAGHQTIRLVDTAPYTPSGIKISQVKVLDSNSGIRTLPENMSSTVDVYTLQGVRIKSQVNKDEATADLPSGIYIIGNKKFIINK